MHDTSTRSPGSRVVTASPILDDCADGPVAEDRPPDLGDVALEDVEVGAADRGRVDADDRVGRIPMVGSGFSSQLRSPGPW
jgi:hypothetical protein